MLVSKPKFFGLPHYSKVWLAIVIILLLAYLSFTVVYASGLGGYVSEKLVTRVGVATPDLLIAREGVSSPSFDVGMGPALSTLEATGVVFEIGSTVSTLNGNVVSLNGFSFSNVWFEWGYTPGTLVNITPTQTVVAPGLVSTTISGFAPGIVYYRFVGCDDGTNYGSIFSFASSGTAWNTLIMTQVVLFVWVGIVVLMVLGLMYAGLPLIPVIIVGAILVIIGAAGVSPILDAFRSWWGG